MNYEWKSYISLGLERSDAVEEHVQRAGEEAALPRGARHGEGFTASSHTVSKQQA